MGISHLPEFYIYRLSFDKIIFKIYKCTSHDQKLSTLFYYYKSSWSSTSAFLDAGLTPTSDDIYTPKIKLKTFLSNPFFIIWFTFRTRNFNLSKYLEVNTSYNLCKLIPTIRTQIFSSINMLQKNFFFSFPCFSITNKFPIISCNFNRLYLHLWIHGTKLLEMHL